MVEFSARNQIEPGHKLSSNGESHSIRNRMFAEALGNTEAQKPFSGMVIPNAFDSPDQILKIMLASATHQNPMQPDDSGEFIDRFISYNSMLMQHNQAKVQKDILESTKITQANHAASMVGNTVAVGGRVFEFRSEPTNIRYNIPPGVSKAILKIFDRKGTLVSHMIPERDEQGNFLPGTHSIRFEGYDNNGGELPYGEYLCEMYAEDEEGKQIDIETEIESRLDQVSIFDKEPYYMLGKVRYHLSALKSYSHKKNESDLLLRAKELIGKHVKIQDNYFEISNDQTDKIMFEYYVPKELSDMEIVIYNERNKQVCKCDIERDNNRKPKEGFFSQNLTDINLDNNMKLPPGSYSVRINAKTANGSKKSLPVKLIMAVKNVENFNTGTHLVFGPQTAYPLNKLLSVL